MKIKFDKKGLGVNIHLSGDEVATAIHAYLVSHNIYVRGPRTVTVNGQLCEVGKVYVDPSGQVIAKGKEINPKTKILILE